MTARPAAIWGVSVAAPPAVAPAVADALEPFVDSVSVFAEDDGPDPSVMAVLSGYPAHAAIVRAVEAAARDAGVAAPRVEFDRLDAVDWLSRNRNDMSVIRCGRFLIHGAHHRPIRPRGRLLLEIDAGRAFGSGTHPSTEGCLRALQRLSRACSPRDVIDIGCGSGILAIAAARLWPRARVLALDSDPEAVETTRENAAINQVAPRISVRVSTGLPKAPPTRPADVIAANILARPLIALSGDAARWTRGRGRIVLSGVLHTQQASVLAAYRRRGFRPDRTIRIGDWSTLMLTRERY